MTEPALTTLVTSFCSPDMPEERERVDSQSHRACPGTVYEHEGQPGASHRTLRWCGCWCHE
jgi:hypothetical protein